VTETVVKNTQTRHSTSGLKKHTHWYVCVFSLSGPKCHYGSLLSRLQEYFSIDAIK